MKIIEFARFGGPEVLELREKPDLQAGEGQIALEVKACGLNFADIMARQGSYPPVPSAPFSPGFEVAGVVSDVGAGVENFQIGDHAMGLLGSGGYASQAVLDAQVAVKLPPDLDFAPATALLVQGLTAYFLLEEGRLHPGDAVLIPGAAGGVGSLAVQIAKLKGAGKVIGLASPSKHEIVKNLGTDVVLDYTQAGWGKSVMDATGGRGVDLYLDSQGDLTGEGAQVLAEGARWLIFGWQSEKGGAITREQLSSLIFRNITLRGYTVYYNIGQEGALKRALGELVGWVAAGALKIDAGHRFPLEDAAKAHQAVSDRITTGKVVLEP